MGPVAALLLLLLWESQAEEAPQCIRLRPLCLCSLASLHRVLWKAGKRLLSALPLLLATLNLARRCHSTLVLQYAVGIVVFLVLLLSRGAFLRPTQSWTAGLSYLHT